MSGRFIDAFARNHRRAQEAFNRHDFEAAFAGLAADVEWHVLPSTLETGVLRGRDAVVRFFSGVQDGIDWTVESREFVDLGSSRVLIHQHGSAAGRTTQIEGELDFFQIWELRDDGVPFRIREYESREQALEAAGGSEPRMRPS